MSRAAEMGAAEMGAAEMGAAEMRAAEMGAAEMGAAEMGAGGRGSRRAWETYTGASRRTRGHPDGLGGIQADSGTKKTSRETRVFRDV